MDGMYTVQCVTSLMHYKIHDNFGVPYRLPWQQSEFSWYFRQFWNTQEKFAEKKNSHPAHVASIGGEGCPILGEKLFGSTAYHSPTF